jgi:hypothetical protein
MFSLLLAVGEIRAATLYVANNGADSGTCGAQAEPCRSITQTIANASDGDTVIVGPGRYGDIDFDGAPFSPGEDDGLYINKALTIESSHGAQATLLSAGDYGMGVDLWASGATFGRSGHGFTLTTGTTTGGLYQNTVLFSSEANGISVSGNTLTEYSIVMDGSGHTFAQNHLMCLHTCRGIEVMGTGHSLISNTGQGAENETGSIGISGSGHALTNNILLMGTNGMTINASSGVIIRGNSLLAGRGITLNPGSNVAINENNFFGHNNLYGRPDPATANCAVFNYSGASVDATNNFWGAASGPGPNPADEVCDGPGSSTVVAPFATQQFAIRSPGGGGGGNGAPVCTAAQAVPSMLWPANGQFVRVWIIGVGDPDNDPVRISISGVTQDEPTSGLVTGDTGPDATLFGSSVELRAQRNAGGNGRVYRVQFDANDGNGGTCTGAVTVKVPNSQKPGQTIVDDGQNFNSTQP